MTTDRPATAGPLPTRVVYALVTPTTPVSLVGATPSPVATPPDVAFDEVTNGYVP